MDRSFAAISPVPPLRSGGIYYYASSGGGSATSNTLGNGSLRVAPTLIPAATRLSALAAEVSTVGEAGSKVRLCLYADNGNSYPGALLADAGQIAGDSATSQELPINVTLAPGVYWLGAAVQSAPTTQPTVRVITSWTSPILTFAGATLPAAGAAAFGYQATGITGAFPATFPASATPSANVPRMIIKVA